MWMSDLLLEIWSLRSCEKPKDMPMLSLNGSSILICTFKKENQTGVGEIEHIN